MRSLFRYSLRVFLALIVAWILLPRPDLEVAYSQCVYDRNGNLLRVTLSKDEKYRIHTPLAQIAPEMVNATLLQEDRYFWRHPGVNPGALIRSVGQVLSRGKAHSGASTLSMQLARIRYGLNTRTLGGKCLQIYRALQIERHYSKAQILEAYFNLAPYGRNIEGVGAASLLYFGKTPDHLTLPETVALSVIPQSPARRTLHRKENPALQAAQTRLFSRLAPESPAAAFRACAVRTPPFLAPHFTWQVLRENRDAPHVTTTLDTNLQQMLEDRLRVYIAAQRGLGVHNAAALLVDAPTMEVLAQVGSGDFLNNDICGQIDGTRCRRSPGSTLKPFVYALAVDQGLIHPLSILIDAPYRFGEYNPENFDREFLGPVRAADALARSRNLPAISLGAQLTPPGLYGLLQTAGIKLPRPVTDYGLTLPLGGAEVSSQELAQLYGALANGGICRPLQHTLSRKKIPGVQLFSPEAAFLVRDMLVTNVRNTPVYWKTGTSNGFHDAWTVGIFDRYILVIWIGNFDGRPNPAFIGRTCAAPLFFQILENLRASGRLQWQPHAPAPELNLKRVEFCAISGQLPQPFCKERCEGWFIPGLTSIATCAVHREVLIDTQTGLRVGTDDGSRQLERVVHEFWPSNLHELFAKAGVPRRVPPPFLPRSGPEALIGSSHTGQAPRILSPQAGLIYVLEETAEETRTLSLRAQCEADVERIFWFSDKQFLGVSERNAILPWHPAPGTYQLTALDNHGRSDSVEVRIQQKK